MTNGWATVKRMGICYLIAGAASLLFRLWPEWEGHAHIPFSGFPEVLIWTPIAPLLLLADLVQSPAEHGRNALVFLAVLGLAWRILSPGKP